MHAPRARIPLKRTAKKTAAKKSTAKKAAPKLAPVQSLIAQALPEGVASLAAHRAALPQRSPVGTEIYALVEWIAPARESWRRGELEVRRSACMPMTATLQADGVLALTDLPGQGDALVIERTVLEALVAHVTPSLQLALPGLRVTVTAEDVAPALPAPRPTGQVLAFRRADL